MTDNVTVVVGDLFESKAQTWVNTVNTVGVMGKGIALGFRKRFPEMFEDYRRRCDRGEVALGRPYLYERPELPWILNFPTKDHWRSPARLDAIEQGLGHLLVNYRHWGVESLAVPPLGCGEGQLEWAVVGPTLFRWLERLEVPVELFAPYGTPHEELAPSFLGRQLEFFRAEEGPRPEPRVNSGELALVAILDRVEREPYRAPVGRVQFQKLAYFATEAGIHTGLKFRRASYGPFADGLKKIVARLINNGLLREDRRGQAFLVRVGPTFSDAIRAFGPDLHESETTIARVADLVVRFRTTRQAEAAATAHFAAKELAAAAGVAPSEQAVLDEVREWKQNRQPPLSANELAIGIRNLALLDWVDVEGSTELPIGRSDPTLVA